MNALRSFLVLLLTTLPALTAGLRSSSGRECPLRQTDVRAEITGMLSRVTVVQQFVNTAPDTIEATYVLPLPHDAAVDRMTMHIGDRIIRAAGQTASRLDEERPNIFTQSVANIPPGAEVRIELSYFHLLTYQAGAYEFAFPTVVGPRYNSTIASQPAETDDADPGHAITFAVSIDAGVPIGNVQSRTHDISVTRTSPSAAEVRLTPIHDIPDRDFLLRFDTAGQTIQTSLLTHRAGKGGFFTLFVQPPERALAADVTPRELIFVLDTSGSMSGSPIEKAKETMQLALADLTPRDTFNLITFSGDTHVLFNAPVPATPDNRQFAKMFLASRSGSGGTEMMKAIQTALAPSAESGRVRVVCFMTDGFVGNDREILAEIRTHPEARVFAFGIGGSVNRFLLDGMALEGRGEVEYVGLKDDAAQAVERFRQRIREPILTELNIDWDSLPVTDVYPKRIPDLFSAKPVIVTGRYTAPARGTVQVQGVSGGRGMTIAGPVDFPASQPAHESLVTWWARQRVADLSRTFGNEAAIRQTGLDYGILTAHTSLLAVEDRVVNFDGQPRRVEVPLALPAGMARGGGVGSGSGIAYGTGSGAGTGGGVYRVGGITSPPEPISKVQPQYTDEARKARLRGTVILLASVMPDGTVNNVRVIRPLGLGLDEQAVEAVQKWRFRPAMKDGRPVAASINLEISFPPPVAPDVAAKLQPELLRRLESMDDTLMAVTVQLHPGRTASPDKLTAAGLTLINAANAAGQIRGHIPPERLADLARLDAVRYIILTANQK